ncbi:unnamed protein product [Arabidopsis lyrata]|nr:unnamed protein product [Arabidopsis lyrata]
MCETVNVSHVLGLPMSKVVCKTKRLGGGFGGKETRSAFIAAAASVPCYLLNSYWTEMWA